jgi:general secretion pathway protein A
VAVYEAFYGLRESPFNITPDPRFLFLTASHRNALHYLDYGIRERKGFLVMTGEVGVGKTLLIRTLLQRLDARTETALVMNARLSFKQLLFLALRDWNLPVQGRSKMDLLLTLQDFLVEVRNRGGNVVLIIDEAQNLSPLAMEEFRLLSNLETTAQKLLQIVLVGQPELQTVLNRHTLRQLRQRIPGISQITHLDGQGVAAYVRHRLRVAGWSSPSGWIFDEGALLEIFRCTGGIPRLVNLTCDRALLVGYQRHLRDIDAHVVRESAAYLRDGTLHSISSPLTGGGRNG